MRLYPIAIAASLLASPALAAPAEDSACIAARLSAEDVTTIVESTMAGGSAEAVTRITGPLDACSQGQEWGPRRRAEAAAYTIGVLGRRVLGPRLGALGVDSAAIDRWFARQSDEFRTTAFMGMSEAAMEAVYQTLAGREVTAETMERAGGMIGGYLAALVIIERIDRGLGMEQPQ